MKISLRIYIVILIVFLTFKIHAQQYKSIMQEESEHYASLQLQAEEQFDSLRFVKSKNEGSKNILNKNNPPCVLNKKVFGWHPYWSGNVYNNYQWNLLSDLCYFDYTTSSSSGNNTNGSFAWNTASVVTVAKNNGVKVHICATMFSGHSTFWGSVTAQNTFINNIISLLNNRQGNGVNIDFEGMGASDKIPFTSFITNLNAALNAANPNYELSICTYAVDWSGVFDIAALNNQVDFYTVMGYDYYYSGSAQAGPTAPLYNFQTGYNYTIAKSITYYLKQGVPNNKLILGLPYYGREWEVVGNTVPANTTGAFNSSRTLSYINNNPLTYSISNKFWEGNCFSPYYQYLSGGNNRQCFIDDIYSIGRKYDLVNQRGIGGIGIWALGYDDGMSTYWNAIQDKFSTCAPIICNDSIYDMGGPARNYYDNEKYDYTLTAPTGSVVELQFKSFGTELNFDSLWLYNGTTTLSPLIGSYTGTNSPGTVNVLSQNITLRFKSDGSTVSFGFKAIKNCLPQIIAGTEENKSQYTDLIFPNPTNENLTIISSNRNTLEITDILGKIVFENRNFSSEFNLNLKKLEIENGIYFVILKNQRGNCNTRKIIFQK